jgi:uracil-DNA glycosylase
MDIKAKIADLGSRMLTCKNPNCLETRKLKNIDLNKGVVPRFLYYKEESNSRNRIMFVGENPHHAIPEEIDEFSKFYKQSREKENWTVELYQYMCRFFEENCLKNSRKPYYYDYVNTIIDKLGLVGDVIYTEMFMCEKDGNIKPPDPLYDLICDSCYEKYLSEEIAIFQPHIVIAASSTVYNYVIKKDIKAPILGVPHPTSGQPPCIKARSKLLPLFGSPDSRDYCISIVRGMLKDTDQGIYNRINWTTIPNMRKSNFPSKYLV